MPRLADLTGMKNSTELSSHALPKGQRQAQ
jgi:hypothetical protein